MSPEVLIAFIAACILLGLTPGPNMSLILASTLSSGLRAGLTTLAGTTTGLALLVAAAAAGMSSVMVFMSEWFDVIRWVGALYLVYLGVRSSGSCAAGPKGLRHRHTARVPTSISRACWSACPTRRCCCSWAPSCRSSSIPPAIRYGSSRVLAVLFVVVLAAVDVAYTLAVARARATLDAARLRLLDGAAGVLLLLGGLALAMARKP